jgi:2-(1,2-epoxy-1,2-dihydrophenyl)acetyl-CoA isomerase
MRIDEETDGGPMPDERVRLQQTGDVLELVLCSGSRGNAIDRAAAEELRDRVAEASERIAETGGPQAVLVRAEGKNFCVGGDLRAFQGADAFAYVGAAADAAHKAISGLLQLPVPVVVAVQGAVAGGGLGLALTGDLIVAARTARFRMAYTAVGLTPDLGTTWLLPRVLGRQRALDLTLTNRTLSAEEAMDWGLVSRVVDDAEVQAAALQLAADLASGIGAALRGAKSLLAQGAAEPALTVHLEREAASIAAASETPEAQAAIAAFLTR